MNIYFLRHGETEENIKGTYYGRLESGLTERGRAQARGAGERLKGGVPFSKIYVSERGRTLETLKEALGEDMPYSIDKRINEMDFGGFEGKAYGELSEEYRTELKLWEKDWKGFVFPDGESIEKLYSRVSSFMEDVKMLEDENILVVTHGGVLRCVYCYVLGSLDSYWKFGCHNADIALIKYEYGNLYIDSIIHG